MAQREKHARTHTQHTHTHTHTHTEEEQRRQHGEERSLLGGARCQGGLWRCTPARGHTHTHTHTHINIYTYTIYVHTRTNTHIYLIHARARVRSRTHPLELGDIVDARDGGASAGAQIGNVVCRAQRRSPPQRRVSTQSAAGRKCGSRARPARVSLCAVVYTTADGWRFNAATRDAETETQTKTETETNEAPPQ